MATPPLENLAPVPEIEPGRPRTEGVRVVSDETDLRALRELVASGLVSGSEEHAYRSLRPAGRGEGRARDR